MLLKGLIDNSENMCFLIISSEDVYRKRLVNFYRRLNFKILTQEDHIFPVMVHIPNNTEKLKEWERLIEKEMEDYSFEIFKSTKYLRIWGRSYAPWLNFFMIYIQNY